MIKIFGDQNILTDFTEKFNEVGHSKDAYKMLDKYEVLNNVQNPIQNTNPTLIQSQTNQK